MGASLEARAPFLDRNLVALSWQIPLEKKISRNEGKKILKQILYRYVPRKLVDRPKAGFGIPLDTWLRKELKAWACDLLSENRLRQEGFFKTALVQKMLKDHLAGKANNQYHLWNILMFQAWLEREKRPG